MFKAIGQFFASTFALFSALEKGANSLDHLAGIAEAEAKGLAHQMDIEREDRIKTLRKQLTSVAQLTPHPRVRLSL